MARRLLRDGVDSQLGQLLTPFTAPKEGRVRGKAHAHGPAMVTQEFHFVLRIGIKLVECHDNRLSHGLQVLYMTVQRSEEHTSELQSRQYLVCRLLLEKKKYNECSFSHHITNLDVD